jgi:hypothetical protein
MPLYNNKIKRGPLDHTGQADPNLNHSNSGAKRIGSGDGLLSGGSYDFNIDATASQNQQRFGNQGWYNWAGYSLAKLGGRTATGVAEGIGSITALGSSPGFLIKDKEFMDKVDKSPVATLLASPYYYLKGNSFHNAFEQNPILVGTKAINTFIDDNTTVYQEDGFNDLNFGQQLSRFSQLTSGSIESLAFLTSSAFGAGLLGKLNAGNKLVSSFAKAKNLDAVLDGAKAADYAGKAAKIDFAISHGALTTSESATEAADAFSTIKRKLEDDRSRGKNTMSDEEIENEANGKARNVFWLNMATASITNIPTTKLFKGVFSKALKSDIDLGIKLGGKGFEAENLTGLNRMLYSKEFLPKVSRDLFTNIVAEGLEESLQYSIQDINEKSKGELSLKDSFKKFFSAENAVASTEGIFTDKERGKAAGLGALIGAASVGVAAMADRNLYANHVTARDAAIEGLNSQYKDFLTSTPYLRTEGKSYEVSRTENPDGSFSYNMTSGTESKSLTTTEFTELTAKHDLSPEGGKFVEKGTHILDANGNPTLDTERLAESISTLQTHRALDDLIENEELYGKSDKVKLDLLRAEKLRVLAQTALESGTMDLLIERFEATKADTENHEKYELKSEELDETINELKKLANLYENVNKDLLATSTEGNRLNSIRKKRMFTLGARAATLQSLLAKSEQENTRLKSDIMFKAGEDFTGNSQNRSAVMDAVESSIDLMAKEKFKLNELENTIRDLATEQGIQDSKKITALYAKIASTQEEIDNLKNQREELKTIQGAKNFLRPGDVETLVNNSLKNMELKEALRQTSEVYDSYLTTKDLDKVKGIEDTAFLTRDEFADPNIPINANTTAKALSAFVAYKAKKLNNTSKREYAFRQFMNEITRRVAQSYSGASLFSLNDLNALIKQLESMPEGIDIQTYNIAFDIVQSIRATVLDPSEQVRQYFEDEANDTGEEYDEVVDDYIRILDDFQSKLSNLKVINGDFIQNMDESTEEAKRSLYRTGLSVMMDFNTAPDEYEDLASAKTEIVKLTKLLELFKELEYDTRELETILSNLQAALPLIEKNLLNKELKNAKQNRLVGEAIIPILNNPEFLEMLTAAGNVDVPALLELTKQDPYLAYLTLVQALWAGNTNASLEVITRLKEELDSRVSTLLPNSQDKKISVNPIKFLIYYISQKYGHSSLGGAQKTPAIQAFLEDYDLVKFMNGIENEANEEIKGLLRDVLTGIALNDLTHSLTSEINATDILSKIKSLVERSKDVPAPSVAQERALLQLGLFLSSKNDSTQPHKNITALKAPPGAGKTLLIIPYIKHILGITNDELLPVATQQRASDNLAKGIGLNKGYTSEQLVDMFDNNEIPDDVKVIILDEAASQTNESAYTVAKAFTKWQRRNDNDARNVKIIYLYDPNQGLESADGSSPFEASPYNTPTTNVQSIEEGGNTPFGAMYYSHNIFDVLPLPVSYRSDIPQILSLQNRFLDKVNVPSDMEASTSKDASDMKDIMGTYVETGTARLLAMYDSSAVKNPDRTRIIIVSNEQAKSKYPGKEALTAKEAVGLTFDEVYVDMPSNTTASVQSYNQQVYTAISRARLFTYLGNYSGTNSLDTSMADKIELNRTFKSSRHDESVVEKNHQIDVINSIVTLTAAQATPVVAPVSTPSPVNVLQTITEPEIEVVEDIVLDAFNETPAGNHLNVNQIDPLPQNEGRIYPNNSVVKQLLESGQSDLRLVKEYDNGLFRYRLIHMYNSTSGFDVAILDELAFMALNIGDLNTVELSGGEIKNLDKQSGSLSFPASVGSAIMASTKLELDPQSHTVRYIYGNTPTEDFSSPDSYRGLVTRFLESYSKEYPVSNVEEILDNLDAHTNVVVFTSDSQVLLAGFTREQALNIPLGKPLLIIRDIANVQGTTLTQFIELQTPVIDPTSKEFERIHGKELTRFTEQLNKFEDVLSKANLSPELLNYTLLRAGQALTNGDKSYYPFHAFVVALSEYRKTGRFSMAPDNVTNAFNRMNPNIALPVTNGSSFPKELVDLAVELDTLLHGEPVEGKTFRRNYGGKAQFAFDKIASSNMIVELPNMTVKVLRSTRRRSGTNDTYVGGLTMLGPITFAVQEVTTHGATYQIGMPYNQLFPPEVISQISERLARNPRLRWGEAPAIKALLSGDDRLHTVLMTSEDLSSMLLNGGYSKSNSGFGLRMPLYIKDMNQFNARNDTRFDLHGSLQSTFLGVMPTRIGIVNPETGLSSFQEIPIPVEEVETEPVAEIKEQIRESVVTGEEVVFTPAQEAEFKAETGVSIEEARDNFESQTVAEFLKKPNFGKLMRTVLGMTTNSLTETFAQLFNAANQAVDRELRKAPRDFVASFVVARLLKETSAGSFMSNGRALSKVLPIIEYYYSSTKSDVKTNTDFANRILKLASIEQIKSEAKDINESLEELANKFGVPFTSTNINSEMDILPFVRSVVLMSSEFRKMSITPEVNAVAAVESGAIALLRENSSKPTEEVLTLLKAQFPEDELTLHVEKSLNRDEDVEVIDILHSIDDARGFSLPLEFEELNPVSYEAASRQYRQIFNPFGFNFIKRIFFSKKGENFRIVSANSLIRQFGKELWGVYSRGVIQVVGQDGRVGMSVVLHEAIHKVIDLYLTPKEKIRLFNLAKKRYGDLPVLELEERIANDFMAYQRKEKKFSEKITSIFRKIARFFNFTYNNLNSLEDFFESTLDGNFKDKVGYSKTTRFMEIERFYKDLAEFTTAKNLVLDLFKEVKNSASDKILSFDEIIGEVFNQLINATISQELTSAEAAAIKNLVANRTALNQFTAYFFGNTPAISSINKATAEARKDIEDAIAELTDKINNIDREADEDGLEVNESERQELIQLKEELTGLSKASILNETVDSDAVDPESKLTGVVKQRLVAVEYRKNRQVVRADFTKLYGILMNLVSSVDNSSFDNLVDSIKDRTRSLIPRRTAASHSEYVANNEREAAALFIEAELDSYEKLKASRPKNISFLKDANSKYEYMLFHPTKDVSNLTYTTAKKDPSITISFYDPSLSYDAWVRGVVGENYSDAKTAFDFYEQSNFVKSLVGAVSSLRRNRPAVGVRTYDEGVYKTSYIGVKESGARAVLENDIINGFMRANDKADKKIFSDEILKELANFKFSEDYDTTYNLAKRLLLTFGIKIKKGDASSLELQNFIKRSKTVLPKINEKTDTPYNVITNESSLISLIIEAASTTANLVQPTSFMRGDGKKAFLWVDASYQTSILTSIVNSINGLKGMRTRYFSINKGELKSTSPFLTNNIFFNGLSRIYSFLDHDSIKWKGREENAKILHREGPTEALIRAFDLGFINKAANGDTYIQFLPIPSNRRTINGVEVSRLSPKQLDSALMGLIKSQKNRPEPTGKLANNDNYLKNYKKFNLPGLDGLDVNSLTEAEALKKLKEALAEIKEDYKSKILEYLVRESTGTEVSESNLQVDVDSLLRTYTKISSKKANLSRAGEYRKKLAAYKAEIDKLSLAGDTDAALKITEEANEFVKSRTASLNDILDTVVENFVANHVVNSYNLSQMLYGDGTFYKSKEDLTKRIQVFTATGDVPIVDEADGYPPVSRIGVIQDIESALEELEDMRDEAARETVNEADGQGFMLPEAYEQLAKARGRHTEDDITLKTVYSSTDELGIPTLLKYSIIVLTDELIGYNAGKPINVALHNLREAMRNPADGKGRLDQAIFSSGVKSGGPSNKNQARVNMEDMSISFQDSSIISIDNRHFRFQLNPASEVEKTVANPSQITAFIDSNGINPNEAYEVHKLNAGIMAVGMRLISHKLGISRKGRLTKSSENVMRKRAIQANEGMTGKESLVNALAAKRNGKYSVSLNLPMIGDGLVSSLASIVSSSTVGFRFPGSKLVLQSEFGTYTNTKEKLKFKDKDGFTEVMLPEVFREFLSEGDVVANDAMVGFRIPSTNYHSAIALRVVGFYKVPPGSAGNIVIAPAALVFYHGSDFDVDSLFLIKKDKLKEDISLDTIISKYTKDKTSLKFKKGDRIGADKTIDMVGGLKLTEYLERLVGIIDNAIQSIRSSDSSAAAAMEDDLRTVASMYNIAAQNSIVHILSSNIRNIKNRKDLLTPISFARVSKMKADILKNFISDFDNIKKDILSSGLATKEELEEKKELLFTEGIDVLDKKDLTPKAQALINKYSLKSEDTVIEMIAKLEATKEGLDGSRLSGTEAGRLVNPKGTMHSPTTQLQIHSNTYSGVSLTGVAANTGKILSYLFSAARILSIKKGDVILEFTRDGKYSSEQMREMLNSQDLPSINSALASGWEIVTREEPKLKEGSRIKFLNHTFDSLSRNEKNLDGTPKMAYKYGDTLINIFETIDTVINLAIDNVKEQKLFVLGITNFNSNAFLAGISLGIPLNTVVMMFKTPFMAKASLSPLNTSKMSKDMLKELSNLDINEVINMVEEYSHSQVGQFKTALANGLEAALKTLSINPDYLERSYLGDSNVVGDFVLNRYVGKLNDLGTELYDNSELFSILRGMPSTKEDIDTAVDAGLKYQTIQSLEATNTDDSIRDQLKTQVIKEKLEAIRSSDLYKNSSPVKQSSLEDLSIVDSLIEAEVERRYNATLVTKIVSNKVAKNFRTKQNSVFEDLSVFNLPHMFQAWNIVKRLQYLIENTFALYSSDLKEYADKIADHLGVTYGKGPLRYLVAKEFFKFITSDMKIILPYGTVDFKVPNNITQVVMSERGDTTLYGADAWAHNFTNKFENFRKQYPVENEFLKSVEVVSDFKGRKSLKITSDKTTNPETILKIKEGVLSLLQEEEITELGVIIRPREMVLDLFKYAALSQGMFYSRTGFALVFPVVFSEAYSNHLDDALDRVFSRDERGNISPLYTSANTSRLFNTFMYQLVRNNPDILPYRKGAIKTAGYTNAKGDYKRIYTGNKDGVFFDLSYPNAGDTPPVFISDFNKEVFMFVTTKNGTDYYRKLTSKNKLTLHQFPTYYAKNEELDLSVFSDPNLDGPMFDAKLLQGRTINYPVDRKVVSEGDVVYIHDYSNPNPTEISTSVVTNVEKTAGGYSITIGEKKSMSLLKGTSKEVLSLLPVLASSKFIDTPLNMGAKTIGDTNSDINLDLAKGFEHVLQAIKDLPDGIYKAYRTLFNGYYANNPTEAITLAKALSAKTRTRFDILDIRETVTPEDVVSDEVSFTPEMYNEDGIYYSIKKSESKKTSTHTREYASLQVGNIYFAGMSDGNPVYFLVSSESTKSKKGLLLDGAVVQALIDNNYIVDSQFNPENIENELQKLIESC